MSALDRLVWADTATLMVGDLHLGLRSSSPELGAWVRRAFAAHLVEDVEAPANYSFVAAEPAPARRPAGFHLLYRSSTRVVRSVDPRRVVSGLLRHLSSHHPADGAGLRRLQAVAFVGERGALLAPAVLHQYLSRLERPLNAGGVRIVDAPWATVDSDTAELVVPEPVIDVDPSASAELTTTLSAGRDDPPVPSGRYPLLGWAFLEEGEAPSRAQAVAMATRMVDERSARAMPETLQALGRLMRTVDPVGLPWGQPPVLARTLLGMM